MTSRRRVLLAVALAGAPAIAALGCGSDDATTAAPRLGLPNAGASMLKPPGWHLATPPITSVGYPVERLLLTSYATKRGGNCGPDRAERDLPADGALVYLFEYRPKVGSAWAHLKHADFPRRPAHIALRKRDLASYECWRVPSYAIRFRAADRPFQLHVAFGPHATAARRAQVRRIIDGLRFTALPAPPPDPYAGWHALNTETGDTLRTPPGWAAAVVPSPRRRAQPRTLALTTNRPLAGLPTQRGDVATTLPRSIPRRTLRSFPSDGVLLSIREDLPGPATAAWPPLPGRPWPRADDFTPAGDRIAARAPRLTWERAGAQQRRTRLSLWLVSGPDASAADRARALKSAASFAFSVGESRNRPCRRACQSGRPVRVIPTLARGDRVTPASLERGLRTNPNDPAVATCRAATSADRARAEQSFGRTKRLFVCEIALRRQPAATFDVQVLGNACFVAVRRGGGQADHGCVR